MQFTSLDVSYSCFVQSLYVLLSNITYYSTELPYIWDNGTTSLPLYSMSREVEDVVGGL